MKASSVSSMVPCPACAGKAKADSIRQAITLFMVISRRYPVLAVRGGYAVKREGR
jgi:hypothetical protein